MQKMCNVGTLWSVGFERIVELNDMQYNQAMRIYGERNGLKQYHISITTRKYSLCSILSLGSKFSKGISYFV